MDVDLWSVGCIIAELIIKHPLMPGENFVDQWDKVCDIVGTPPLRFFDKVLAEDVKIYCLNRPHKQAVCFKEKFTDALFGGSFGTFIMRSITLKKYKLYSLLL